MLSVRPLGSSGVTPLPRYYGPLRLPSGPLPRLCLPAARWSLPLPPKRVSQAPQPSFPRALSPTTPEGPASALACCFPTGIAGFILPGGLAAFSLLTRPNRVHLPYGSPVRLPSSRPLHYWGSRSFGSMQNRPLHGELLSAHKINQAYPGVPRLSKRSPRDLGKLEWQ